MKTKIVLDYERLKQSLSYDPETGVFTWIKKGRGRMRFFGKPAGRINPAGYSHIEIDGSDYYAHRLAWLYVHGSWPANQIDHKNGLRSDNRLANLQEATNSSNGQKKLKYFDTTSPLLTGVRKPLAHCGWIAELRFQGKSLRVTGFDSPEEAHAMYVELKRRLHDLCSEIS